MRTVHQCKQFQGSRTEVQTEEKVDEWSLVSLMQHSGSDDSQKQDPLSSECLHQKMVSIYNMLEATSDKCDKHQSDTKNESDQIKHNNSKHEEIAKRERITVNNA